MHYKNVTVLQHNGVSLQGIPSSKYSGVAPGPGALLHNPNWYTLPFSKNEMGKKTVVVYFSICRLKLRHIN